VDSAIQVWSGNLARDPSDFISATNLASMHLARGRITGDGGDFDRAGAAADAALRNHPDYLAARLLSAELLLATHDFPAAEAAAQQLLAADPGLAPALAILADAQLERGSYDAAEQSLAELEELAAGPAVTARRAHLSWLQGEDAEATRQAASAWRAAVDADVAVVERAWYAAFAGELALRMGDLPAAVVHFTQGLELNPGDVGALVGIGHARAAGGDLDSAMEAYEAAAALRPSPATLAALAELHLLVGDADGAAERWAQIDLQVTLADVDGRPLGRDLALIWADLGREVDRAVVVAERDLEVRPGVFGWDAYAWALHAAGRFGDAQEAMQRALAEGTTDPLLSYHAGMIAAANSHAEAARAHLQHAVAPGSSLLPWFRSRAEAALAGLPAGASR
jgi:tetratricopeptide (TPR) repeat protein